MRKCVDRKLLVNLRLFTGLQSMRSYWSMSYQVACVMRAFASIVGALWSHRNARCRERSDPSDARCA